VAAVIKAISAAVGKGPLVGLAGLAGTENAQGEQQKQLDVLAERAREALGEYLRLRREQPNFANARSLRNALDRARLRQARRLLEAGRVDADMLMTIEAEDIRASRVFGAARDPAEEAAC